MQVKYLEPTATQPARWKAWEGPHKVTVPHDATLSDDENARQAAQVLCNKLGNFIAIPSESFVDYPTKLQ